MSNTKLNIHQRILAVMADINYVQKSDKKVNNQYTFVTHDAVSATIHPMLVKHGIVAVPRVKHWKQDGNRTEVDVEVDFINVDTPTDLITVPCFGFGIDPQDKGPGKAVSYATKYAMLKLFVLETGDDPERDSIDHVSENVNETLDAVATALETGDWVTLCELDRQGEKWLAAWSKLDTRKKSAVKKLMEKPNEYRDLINRYAEDQDIDGINQLVGELSKEQKAEVWRRISADAKDYIKNTKEAA